MAYPTAAQVLNGVVFGASNELTGTYVAPSVANVLAGVHFGAASALEGTYVAPAAADVKADVEFGVDDVGTLEAADYADMIQERRAQTTVIGSLVPDSRHGETSIAIYDTADSGSRALAHARAINGKWLETAELPNGKTYRLVYKDRNNSVKRVTTVTT